MDKADEYLQRLHAVGESADDKIELAETALCLAALDHKNADLAPYREHLDRMASDARANMAILKPGMSEAVAAARTLADTIGARHGYVGDNATFDDPQNADLMRVIDRRRGLPVSLGILYLDLAHRLGVQARGLNTPGHFLMSLGDGDHQKVLDPFNGGVMLDTDELRPWPPSVESDSSEYGPVGRRDVLLRLLNNIRSRAHAAKDTLRVLTIAERMVIIAPQNGDLWLDLARACQGVGKMNGAIRAAQTSIRLSGEHSTAGREAAFVLSGLKRIVN